MYNRNSKGWMKHADFFNIDAITQHFVLVLIYAIRYSAWMYTDSAYVKLALLMFLWNAFVFLGFDTMHNVLKRGLFVEFKETLRHCRYIFALLMLSLYLMDGVHYYPQSILFSALFLHIFLGYGSRVFWKWFVKNHRLNRRKQRVIALLDAETAEETMKRINHNQAEQHEIIGIILTEKSDRTVIDDVPVVACIEQAAAFISQQSVDSLYIDCAITAPGVSELMEACKQMAVPIHYRVPDIYGAGVKHVIERIGGETVLTSSLNYATPRERITKRTLDILGGLVGSVIALLLMLIIGPMIKKASPGPVLYKQERIGLNGRHFTMYKLRSMHVDADQRKQELMESNRVADGRMFKMDDDPRIIGNEILPDGTCKKGIGDFIRRTSLDEFPQFFNVLLGEMSLVGTRPPTVDEWESYEYHHRARLSCKPGITGLWQVSGRSEITDFEEVVKLDTEYITNWTFGLDIQILLKTIIVVCGGKGAL